MMCVPAYTHKSSAGPIRLICIRLASPLTFSLLSRFAPRARLVVVGVSRRALRLAGHFPCDAISHIIAHTHTHTHTQREREREWRPEDKHKSQDGNGDGSGEGNERRSRDVDGDEKGDRKGIRVWR